MGETRIDRTPRVYALGSRSNATAQLDPQPPPPPSRPHVNARSRLISNSSTLHTTLSYSHSYSPTVDRVNTTAMSGLQNSPFGKRLRAAQTEEDGHRRNRPRVNQIFGPVAAAPGSTPSLDSRPTTSESGVFDTPVDAPGPSRGHDYGDRFVPSRDIGDIRTAYHLMDESPTATPSKSRIIPTESDALKEQANAIFTSILHTEVTPSSPSRSSSPTRPASTAVALPSTPNRLRLFNYNSPSRSNPATPTRRLDTPVDEAYSISPVRAESRQLLESPRRQLRSVCKTPYRVLDAPELADDFYLNLVDWSSTNVLGVGLGSCVYLWSAHSAQVSKLCDLSDTNDTISSLSWVQKVCMPHSCSQLTTEHATGLNTCRRYTLRQTQNLRCTQSLLYAHIHPSPLATDRCSFVESARPQFRLSRSLDSPSRRTRSWREAIQTRAGPPAGGVWLAVEQRLRIADCASREWRQRQQGLHLGSAWRETPAARRAAPRKQRGWLDQRGRGGRRDSTMEVPRTHGCCEGPGVGPTCVRRAGLGRGNGGQAY